MAGGKWKLAHTRSRLLSRVRELSNGCWEWIGYVGPQGYGLCSYQGRRGFLAHRALYLELAGPIDDGLTLDHLCHTRDPLCPEGTSCRHRRCVNPAHLEPVTAQENNARGGWSRKTHCPRQHPYDDKNTDVRDGRRFCRACRRIRNQQQAARRKAARAAAKTGAIA